MTGKIQHKVERKVFSDSLEEVGGLQSLAAYKTTNYFTVNSAMQVLVCVVFMLNKYSSAAFLKSREHITSNTVPKYIQTEPLIQPYTLNLVE